MTKKEIVKRYLLFVAGLLFISFGIGFTKRAELGLSPITSTPNILSMRFSNISIGTWLIIWNSCLIIGQIIILKKEFKPVQFMQIPLSFIFGWFTDFGVYCTGFFPVENYATRIILVLCGVITIALGITLTVIADIILNSSEAFVKAISDKLNKNFGNIKTIFDICCVSLAILCSLIFFDFTIKGVREGTLIVATVTGFVVKWFLKRISNPINNLLTK